MIGDRLGSYAIAELLGAGGMGVVYRARDSRLQRDVAIKVIAAEAAADPTARARLLQEARTASALNHPHVCTIHDVQTIGDQLFIVMEYVAGRTLRTLARPNGLPIGDCIRFGAQIADALDHAHERGVMHRDLKSANIVVTADGRVKVLDFGLAKYFRFAPDDEDTRRSLTGPDVVLGTVDYMAPERFRSLPGGPSADIWALGVVLYEMATGVLPFTGDSVVEVAAAILERPPAPLRIKLPANLEAVILKCLNKDPAGRWQRPAEIGLALERALAEAKSPATTRPRQPRSRAGKKAIRSLAVLPLNNLSGDPAQEYLADGLTEALITTLAKVSALRVISRTSVMRYKAAPAPLRQIAKELKVDAVIEGSVLRAGTTIRISAQLVDARSDTHLWADSYDRQFSDVLTIQNEIAHAIVGEVNATLTTEERRTLAGGKQVDAGAYEEFLKGRYHWNRRAADDVRRAIQHFQQAIERDPQLAVAYVGLADCYLNLTSYGVMPPRQAMPQAKRLVSRALELDPNLVPALCSNAMQLFSFDWQVDLAEQYFVRAIRRNPSYAVAHQWYALMLTAVGRYHQAVSELAKAQDLDPLSVAIIAHTAWVQYHGRDYDGALRSCRHALDLQPDFHMAMVFAGMAYERAGRFAEAVAELEKALPLAGRDQPGILTLAYVYAKAGRRDEAKEIVTRMTTTENRYVAAYSVAAVQVALGDADAAWRWLEIGLEERGWHMPMLAVDPRFDPLRNEVRFEALVRKIGTFPAAQPIPFKN